MTGGAAATTLFDVAAPSEVKRSAILSDDGLYRYSLMRWWDNDNPVRDLWLMLNPSKANHHIDDPTSTRTTGFSRRFGSGGYWIANLHAYKATKPADMWAARAAGVDITGPDCDGWIKVHAARVAELGGRIICAWGHLGEPERVREVVDMLADYPLYVLGFTQDGKPRHPLMLRADTSLHLWRSGSCETPGETP